MFTCIVVGLGLAIHLGQHFDVLLVALLPDGRKRARRLGGSIGWHELIQEHSNPGPALDRGLKHDRHADRKPNSEVAVEVEAQPKSCR